MHTYVYLKYVCNRIAKMWYTCIYQLSSISGNEDDLKAALATVGPISIAIDASKLDFNFYIGGIYYNAKCKTKNDDLDHAVLVVGYGSENGHDYWLVKNSWGTSWGLKGYIKMSRNRDNNCGIATAGCYPIMY